MTKIAILGDIHIAARNSNKIVEHWQRRFFEEIFWPYMKDNNIKQLIQLGDWFDNRRWINLNSLAFNKEVLLDPIVENGIEVRTIVGNHDIPYKHTLKNNSPAQLISGQVEVYENPGKFTIDDVEFTMIPWLCKENSEECLDLIKEGGDICIGHFEIQGFDMVANHKNMDGLKPSLFDNWNNVWSGHFHSQSKYYNIHYLGTPYQMSWNDFLTRNGFWIFDTHTRELEFINNPLRYFHRIEWDDGYDYPIENIENAYVKLVVENKTDFEKFEKFIDSINIHNPHELKIIESFEEYRSENVKDLISMESTKDIINQYIEDVDVRINKDKVKDFMSEIYKLALEVEE